MTVECCDGMAERKTLDTWPSRAVFCFFVNSQQEHREQAAFYHLLHPEVTFLTMLRFTL